MQNPHLVTPKFFGRITLTKMLPSGTITSQQTVNNIVGKRTFTTLFSGTPVFVADKRVAISTNTPTDTIDGYSNHTPNFKIQNMTNIVAIGFNSTDGPDYNSVDGYTFNSSPNQVVYWGRIPFFGSARSFRTIALVTGNPSASHSQITAPSYAYTTLAEEQTQLPNEIIDIKYEITVSWPDDYVEIYPDFKEDWELYAMGQGSFPNIDQVRASRVPVYSGDLITLGAPYETNKAAGFVASDQLEIMKKNYSGTIDGFQEGDLISGLYLGVSNKRTVNFIKLTNTRRPFHNVFSHLTSSTSFLYESNSSLLARGSWKPIIEMENPSQKTVDDTGLPSMISLKIQRDGGVGEGTYQFTKQPFFGGCDVINSAAGEAYTTMPFAALTKNPVNMDNGNFDPWCICRVSDSQVMVKQNNTFYLVDLVAQSIDSQWTIGTNKDLVGVAMEYVETTDSVFVSTWDGLFEIHLVGGVSQHNDLKCYALCLTPDSSKVIVWIDDGDEIAIFDPSSYHLSDRRSLGAPTFPVCAMKFFSNLKGIVFHSVFLDRWHSGDETTATSGAGTAVDDVHCAWEVDLNPEVFRTKIDVGAAIDDGQGFFWKHPQAESGTEPYTWRGSWRFWAPNQHTVVLGYNKDAIYALLPHYTSGDRCRFHLWGLRPTDDTATHFSALKWSEPPTATSGTLTLISGASCIAPVTSEKLLLKYPKWNIYSTSDFNDNDANRADLICFHLDNSGWGVQRTVSSVNTSVVPSAFWNSYLICMLRENLAACSNTYHLAMTAVYSPEDAKHNDASVIYGWDGANWVKGSLQTKALHTEVLPLIDGLTLRWEDLMPSLTQDVKEGDYYTQVIMDGLLFDGWETAVNLSFSYYFRERREYTFDAAVDTISGTSLNVIAPSDSLFFKIDDDSSDSHRIYIDYNPYPAPLYFNKLSPTQGEVGLMVDTGELIFNSADVGKALGGSIFYVRKLHETEEK